MRDKYESKNIEEKEAVGGDIGDQVPWIQMAGMAPQASDATITHDLAPRLDPDVDWVTNRVTPFELIEKAKDDLKVKRSASSNAQREIVDIDLGILNHEQQFYVAIVRHKIISNERLLMTITGVPETGKITVLKGVTKVVN